MSCTTVLSVVIVAVFARLAAEGAAFGFAGGSGADPTRPLISTPQLADTSVADNFISHLVS